MLENDYKNLNEIIELCTEEIENNDENIAATLDLDDLKSLKNILEYVKNTLDIEDKEE